MVKDPDVPVCMSSSVDEKGLNGVEPIECV